MSFASIGLGNSKPQSGDLQYEHHAIYQTPRPQPGSTIPRHESLASAMNAENRFNSGDPQPLSGPPTDPAPSNSNELPLRASTTGPSAEQGRLSPIPVGPNVTECTQPPTTPADTPNGTPDGSQSQHFNTTSPVQNMISQPGGMAGSTTHCSSCQCTSHQNASDNSEPLLASAPHKPPTNSTGNHICNNTSQFSCMSVRPNPSVLEVNYEQRRVEEGIHNLPESSRNMASTAHQCSGYSFQESTRTHPPGCMCTPVPPVSNATCDSFGSAYQMQSGRIYTGLSNPRRPTSSATSVDSAHHNSIAPMVTQRLSCHGQCSSPVTPHSGLPAAHVHVKRFSTGSNVSNIPRQRQSQLSFPTPLPPSDDISEGYAGYHHRASSLATGYRSYDHEPSVHTQEYYHVHNRLPTRPTSQDWSSPHVYGGAPQPRQADEMPSIPFSHQGVGGNYQGYASLGPSRSNTETSYLASGAYVHGSNSPNPRSLTSRNTLYESHTARNYTQTPLGSVRYDHNVPDGYHHPTQPDLYSIPENMPQSDFGGQWDPVSEAMAANLPSGYAPQPMLSNHTQPLPSVNPSVHFAFGYPHTQHPETAFKEPHMIPANLYSQPTRQWTQKVWGDQEHSLPVRTDSPTPLEALPVDGVCSMPQDSSNSTRMPDSRDYVHPRVHNSV